MTWDDYNSQNWVQQEAKTHDCVTEVYRLRAEIKKYEAFRDIANGVSYHKAIDTELDRLNGLLLELQAIAQTQFEISEKARKEECG